VNVGRKACVNVRPIAAGEASQCCNCGGHQFFDVVMESLGRVPIERSVVNEAMSRIRDAFVCRPCFW
jgi:hypothetical protein